MTGLVLRHLTFLGGNAPASVDFGPNMTLVRGPSDTGKSFIVEAIDFMLGAASLKEIPELSDYSTALLGLELPTGETITLSRSVRGGAFGVHRSDIREGPIPPPDELLSDRHNARNTANLSRFLLSAIELDAKVIRRNAKNETASLSFRDIAHFCVIDETKMQSEIAPALSGQHVTRTKEISTLKLLLEDDDDSSLLTDGSSRQGPNVIAAKIEAIDGLVEERRQEVQEAGPRSDLEARLQWLDTFVRSHGDSIAELSREREMRAREFAQNRQRVAALQNRAGEARALQSRLGLLLQQYSSDLERLDLIGEAGTLLGYFRVGVCVFCGAPPEHQHAGVLGADADTTHLGASLLAEREKTSALRNELILTLDDLVREERDIEGELVRLEEEGASTRERLLEADRSIRPQRAELISVLDERKSIDATLALHRQIDDLLRARAALSNSGEKQPTTVEVARIDLPAVEEFSRLIEKRLQAWNIPLVGPVRYDRNEHDIVEGIRVRAAHGKGVRAIFHAAFTVALAEYCLSRDVPHPGFIVLDSPLVTYRPPDQPADTEDDDDIGVPEAVSSAFYRDMARFPGQVIVMENTEPPSELLADWNDVAFTKSRIGRYGFFPHQA